MEVIEVDRGDDKLRIIADIALPGPTLIYCATRKNVEKVTHHLRSAGLPAGMYHAGMEHQGRINVQEDFMAGRVPVVVATNAFGMGVDKSDIRTIVHHDIPGTVEAYYQEIGRAGRDGRPSRVTLLFRDWTVGRRNSSSGCPIRRRTGPRRLRRAPRTTGEPGLGHLGELANEIADDGQRAPFRHLSCSASAIRRIPPAEREAV